MSSDDKSIHQMQQFQILQVEKPTLLSLTPTRDIHKYEFGTQHFLLGAWESPEFQNLENLPGILVGLIIFF